MLPSGPDKGYSWVIVLCCAYLNLAFFGLVRSSGVMYVAFLHNYGVTRQEASWPFSLCSAVFQLSGPLASVLMHYLTLRKSCIFGSAIATLGVVCCYFANSIIWVNAFYGVIHGAGFGLVATLVPVIVNQYFVRHRTTAMGIAFAGGSISSFVFPPTIEYLLEKYDLRGCFLILGGVIMNTIVASSLLRAPPWIEKSESLRQHHSKQKTNSSKLNNSGIHSSADLVYDSKGLLEKIPDSEDVDPHYETDVTKAVGQNNLDILHKVLPVSQLLVPVTDQVSDKEEIPRNKLSNPHVLTNKMSENIHNKRYQNDSNNKKETLPFLDVEKNAVIVAKRNVNLSVKTDRLGLFKSVGCILRNPMFHLLVITINIFFTGTHCFFMVIVDYGKDKGLLEQEAIYVLFAFSVTDLFGRLCLGWITDRSYVKRKSMLMTNMVILGFFNQLYPVVNQLTGLLVVAALHGLFVGSTITLLFVLQAEYLGMKMLALALGLTSFINGISSFLRPFMIGLFRDVIGTYNWMFHFLGILYFLLTAMWLAEPWLKTKSKVQHHANEETLKNRQKESEANSLNKS